MNSLFSFAMLTDNFAAPTAVGKPKFEDDEWVKMKLYHMFELDQYVRDFL